ncbi:MAG: hypothetical protein H6739_18115 [Alphaproteobacteria bacterium]|nr:hypothetical protein [Alphaproteobacteria bacterium]
MPRPIPPPPPQPSVEETGRAVRLVRGLALAFVVVFALMASTYGDHSPMVDYGREGPQLWNLWKLEQLDVEALRAHPGGRVAWLVGSSILRDAFVVEDINAALEERGSPWRVAKFGFDRNAAGQAFGFVRRLPLREGDLVVHNVYLENFHRDWIHHVDLPMRRVTRLESRAELWQIAELEVPEKIEASLTLPYDYWYSRDSYMEGVGAWLLTPIEGVPEVRTEHRQISVVKGKGSQPHLDPVPDPRSNRLFMDVDRVDFSEDQYNIRGLRRLEALCAEAGAELAVIHIPPSDGLRSKLWTPEVDALWLQWLDAQGIYHFPKVPDAHYRDFTHVNDKGRPVTTRYLIDWLDGRPMGAPTPRPEG